jgi:hypothetical protein
MSSRRLLLGTLLAATALTSVAHAQTASPDDRMRSIEQQIQSLQNELRNVRRDLHTRDAQVRAAQKDAAAARQAATTPPPAPPPPVVAAQPPLPPVLGAPAGSTVIPVSTTGMGKIQIGGVTVTLGGFVALEGIDRSRNQAGTIDTNFNSGIPLPNSANYRTPEFRMSAQQSRLSLLAEAQPDAATHLSGFVETDFLSAGTSSNSNQSNSYTLRVRQFLAEWDNSDLGLHVEGGQGWSLATMNTVGMLPRHENAPLTIDAQYVVGFDWQRQPELRVVKDFNQQFWAGISVEQPQTIFGSSGGPNCLTGANASTGVGGGTLEYAQCGGSNVNSIQAYSDSIAPDVIAKVAADPGYGHYELYGLLRFLGGRVSENGGGRNYETTGEGVGAGMILPVVPKMVDFQVSGLAGRGVGRYGTAQIADVTFSPTGKIEPLAEYSIMGGIVAHPIPTVDVYAYGGAEGLFSNKAYTAGTVQGGYGNPNVSLAGCTVELGSCSANTSGVVEGTIGAWWRVLKGNYGTVQLGAQYEYISRNTFQGVGATKGSTTSPSSNENAFLFSVRYYPFQ